MPTLTFTSGNDIHEVSAAGSYNLTFLAGDDWLTLRHASATTVATMGDGADVVSHRAGTANVNGGAGADRFEVYVSGLTADGGADNDLFNIRGGTGLNLSGGLGIDRFNFYAASANILIHGGDGNDDFFGYNQPITGSLYGDSGSDYFVLFRGAVSLFGGTGNDIYRADSTNPASFVENAGEGTDSVQVARGTTYALPTYVENISVQGFSGSTTSSATLFANDLNNSINGHANLEFIYGFNGHDRLFGKGNDDTLYGGDGNDYLDGGEGIDELLGEAGNDTLNGRVGADRMVGGAGDDTYYVNYSDSDIVSELPGEGTDLVRVTGTEGDYTLPGNVENAIKSGVSLLGIIGNDLGNVLTGTTGQDALYGSFGNDTLNGGAGADWLEGGPDDDTINGGADGDTMFGDEGTNTLNGGAGADNMYGGSGIDTLNGGPGADQMAGGAGDDLYYLDDSGDAVTEYSFHLGTDAVYVGFSAVFYILPDHVENGFLQPAGADTDLYGNGFDNRLTGTSSDNWLIGGYGDDDLYGLGGSDLLSGSEGYDLLEGDAGDDFLWGGTGADVLRGGAGADTYYFGAVLDSPGGPLDDNDGISFYEDGVDIIDLSDIDANTTIAGDQAFTLVLFPTGTAGELWIEYPDQGEYYTLWANVDGGAVDFRVTFYANSVNNMLIDY